MARVLRTEKSFKDPSARASGEERLLDSTRQSFLRGDGDRAVNFLVQSGSISPSSSASCRGGLHSSLRLPSGPRGSAQLLAGPSESGSKFDDMAGADATSPLARARFKKLSRLWLSFKDKDRPSPTGERAPSSPSRTPKARQGSVQRGTRGSLFRPGGTSAAGASVQGSGRRSQHLMGCMNRSRSRKATPPNGPPLT